MRADLCIIGAGAAGITIARELMATTKSVLLLESGGLDLDSLAQHLNVGESVGRDYFPLERTRLRMLGGTTGHWGGLCLPREELDFEARPVTGGSGWPFGLADLMPFYHRAQAVCALGAFENYAEVGGESLLPLPPEQVETRFLQASPIRFGQRYRAELMNAPNLRVILHANVIDIETNAEATRVLRLKLRTLEGRDFALTAATVVLAAGGIENPRLLLASRGTVATGLGNQNDMVGRCFMDHLLVWSGLSWIRLPDRATSPYLRRTRDGRVAYLRLPAATKRSEGLLNAYSLIVSPEAQVMFRPPRLQEDGVWKALEPFLRETADEENGDPSRAERSPFMLWTALEQAPNRASLIRLSDERDVLGMPKAVLDWQITTAEEHSLRRTHELIALALGESGLGRLRVTVGEADNGWRIARGGCHHMGTTRMHVDPRQGVVDADCRVHGTDNLYIAGSSVFPTSGCANPTLTLVALAVRLADHLKTL